MENNALAAADGYAAFIRRFGWHNWQEAVTVLNQTKTGWRVRYETGLHKGKVCNVTHRNWEIMPKPHIEKALPPRDDGSPKGH